MFAFMFPVGSDAAAAVAAAFRPFDAPGLAVALLEGRTGAVPGLETFKD